MLKELIGGLVGQRETRELNRLAQAYATLDKFSGSVLVARGEQVLLRQGYGLANREHSAPNTPATAFRIGSLTKTFTAIAVMQQVERGRLALDDTVSRCLPDYPNGSRITLRHLLSNTSGIPDYIAMPRYETLARQQVTAPELLALFQDEPLLFEPGTDFSYSNSGWVLLGIILEQITGQPYEQIMHQDIFDRLGMTRSGYTWETPVIPQRADGYIDTGDTIQRAKLIDETTMHAAGGLYSTADDLFRWARGFITHRLLTPESLQQMRAAAWEQYGCGLELHRLHGRATIGHSGGLPGYLSAFVYFPDDDVTIILVSNLGSAAVNDLTEGLAAVVLGEPYALPSAQTFVKLSPAALAPYAGDYRVTYFGRTYTLRFVLDGDRLMMHVTGLPPAVVNALSDTTFYTRSKGEVEMTFLRGDDGSVTGIDMNWGGQFSVATRIVETEKS